MSPITIAPPRSPAQQQDRQRAEQQLRQALQRCDLVFGRHRVGAELLQSREHFALRQAGCAGAHARQRGGRGQRCQLAQERELRVRRLARGRELVQPEGGAQVVQCGVSELHGILPAPIRPGVHPVRHGSPSERDERSVGVPKLVVLGAGQRAGRAAACRTARSL
jgi:hypothetical protein